MLTFYSDEILFEVSSTGALRCTNACSHATQC